MPDRNTVIFAIVAVVLALSMPAISRNLSLPAPAGGGGGGGGNPASENLTTGIYDIILDSDGNSKFDFGDDTVAIDLGGVADLWTLSSTGQTNQSVLCVSNNCLRSNGADLEFRNIANSANSNIKARRVTLSDTTAPLVITSDAPLAWQLGGTLGCIHATLAYTDFTDGGGASGTYDMPTQLRDGSHVRTVLVHSVTGFAGDSSASVNVGTSGDPNRFVSNSSHNVFSDDVSGPSMGGASGNAYVGADTTVRVTVTTASDWGNVNAGQLTVAVFYFGPAL